MTLSAAASLDVRIGEQLAAMEGRITNRFERALRRPPAQPFAFPRVGSVVIATPTADAVIDLGGPTQGRVWDLRVLTVGGLTFATTAAGTALVVVSAQQPVKASDVGLSNIVDQANSLPLPAGYSVGQIRISYPDHFYVLIMAGTAGQEYVAAGRFEEYEEAARIQVAAE